MKKLLLTLLTAVMSITAWAEDITATLTGSNMVASGNPGTSYADYLTSGVGITDNDGNEWLGRWTYQKSGSNYYQMVQIKAPESSVTSRLNVPTFQGNIKTITITSTNANSTEVNSGTAATGTFYLTKDWAKSNYSKAENVVASGSQNDKSTVLDLTSLQEKYTGENLYIVSTGAVRIWSVVVVYEKTAKVDVSGVALNQTTLNILKGAQATLTTNITPSNATNKKILWSSDNESVATVANGVVTAKAVGTANITAKSEDNQTISASCAVTVTTPAKTGSIYEKITSNLTDWTGKYLIVYEPTAGTGYAFNASLTTLDDLNNYKEIPTSNKIEGDVLIDQYVFEVEKNGEGYSIKSQTGLYIGLGSFNNGLSTNAKQTQYVNNFSYNTTKSCAEIMIDFGSDEKCYLQFNNASNQMRFRYYKTGSQKDIQLYKLLAFDATISTSGLTTVCLPYDAELNDAAKTAGAQAWAVTDIDENGLHLTAVDALKANGGYILQGTASSTVTLVACDEPAEDGNILKGVTERTNVSSLDFGTSTPEFAFPWILNKDNKFVKYTGSAIPANKAYLDGCDVELFASYSAASLRLNFEGMEDGYQTAISLTPSLSEGEGACYDLYGRKSNGKGLMIQNGKVILVK